MILTSQTILRRKPQSNYKSFTKASIENRSEQVKKQWNKACAHVLRCVCVYAQPTLGEAVDLSSSVQPLDLVLACLTNENLAWQEFDETYIGCFVMVESLQGEKNNTTNKINRSTEPAISRPQCHFSGRMLILVK